MGQFARFLPKFSKPSSWNPTTQVRCICLGYPLDTPYRWHGIGFLTLKLVFAREELSDAGSETVNEDIIGRGTVDKNDVDDNNRDAMVVITYLLRIFSTKLLITVLTGGVSIFPSPTVILCNSLNFSIFVRHVD